MTEWRYDRIILVKTIIFGRNLIDQSIKKEGPIVKKAISELKNRDKMKSSYFDVYFDPNIQFDPHYYDTLKF